MLLFALAVIFLLIPVALVSKLPGLVVEYESPEKVMACVLSA
jgi:hypothetical protein